MARIETIYAEGATPPGGHYSHAVVHNGVVYVSGQLGFEPGISNSKVRSIEQETTNCMTNIETILTQSGSGIDRILKVTIYISDIAYWSRVDKAFAEFMGTHRPARAIVPTSALHHGFNVEIEAIAVAR